MSACSFLGVELSLYEGPQWWICAIVWWCRQRKERPLCLDSKEHHELLSKVGECHSYGSDCGEWVQDRLRTCPHIYLSRLFFCLHLIITRLLSFFLSFFLSFSFDLFLDYQKKLMSRVFFVIIRQGNFVRISLETFSILQFCTPRKVKVRVPPASSRFENGCCKLRSRVTTP
jgi:hypothetical protein